MSRALRMSSTIGSQKVQVEKTRRETGEGVTLRPSLACEELSSCPQSYGLKSVWGNLIILVCKHALCVWYSEPTDGSKPIK